MTRTLAESSMSADDSIPTRDIPADHLDDPVLLKASLAIGGQIRRFRSFGGGVAADSAHCIAEHQRVLEGVRSDDGPAARRAMAAHLDDARVRALASFDASRSARAGRPVSADRPGPADQNGDER